MHGRMTQRGWQNPMSSTMTSPDRCAETGVLRDTKAPLFEADNKPLHSML